MKITLQNLKIDASNLFLLKKPGIYLITNLTNGKKYVGNSAILVRRFKEYMNPLYLERNLERGNSKLLRALMKYGNSNFEFKVLEFIESDQKFSKSERRIQLLTREQYFIDEIKPEYNINLTAGSNLGRIFSEKVRRKMSLAKLGKAGNKKGAILSDETRALFREKSGMAKAVVMLNENDKVLGYFNSIQLASEALGISRNRISRCARGIRKILIEKGKVFKFKYTKEE